MFEKSKIFPYLVGIAALAVAGSAAFYSVFDTRKSLDENLYVSWCDYISWYNIGRYIWISI